MPRIDPDRVARHAGSGYPAPFDRPCSSRIRRRLGDAAGLDDFGVNLLELPPGAWSSQRHWHSAEDEFVWILAGEVTLVDDDGEHLLRAGDCAAFRKGHANGHHLVNRGQATATVLEVGSRRPGQDVCEYPDVDLRIGPGREAGYLHKDGRRYPRRG